MSKPQSSERFLLFDLGNSRTKSARLVGGEWTGQASHARPEDAVAHSGEEAPGAIGIAATGTPEDEDRLIALCQARWPDVPIRRANTGRYFGRLVNAYREPDHMGVDRWMAMIGAWTAQPGACLVIDSGTAVTLDLIDPAGAHQGGWIAPGESLMRAVLAAGTHRVGDQSAHVTKESWGADTPDAVAAGTRAAVEGMIRNGIDLATQSCAELRIVVTGGGAIAAAEYLRSLNAAFEMDPLLVFRGLAAWLCAELSS